MRRFAASLVALLGIAGWLASSPAGATRLLERPHHRDVAGELAASIRLVETDHETLKSASKRKLLSLTASAPAAPAGASLALFDAPCLRPPLCLEAWRPSKTLELPLPEAPKSVEIVNSRPLALTLFEGSDAALSLRPNPAQERSFGLFARSAHLNEFARARWYDPRNASWLSEDPFGDVDSPSLYSFVGHQPHMMVDPLGLVKGEKTTWELKSIPCPEAQYGPTPYSEYVCPSGTITGSVTTDELFPSTDSNETRAHFTQAGVSDIEANAAAAAHHEQPLRPMLKGVADAMEQVGPAVNAIWTGDQIFLGIAMGGLSGGGGRASLGLGFADDTLRVAVPATSGVRPGEALFRQLPAEGMAGDSVGINLGSRGVSTPQVGAEIAKVRARMALYPKVVDPRTGRDIRFPTGIVSRVPKELRVGPLAAEERAAYIAEWHRRGYARPAGGWERYDLHHIQPREFGGNHDFWNVVPVERGTHQQQFNAFWRDYGGL